MQRRTLLGLAGLIAGAGLVGWRLGRDGQAPLLLSARDEDRKSVV